MRRIRTWPGFCVAAALVVLALSAFAWWTSRPVALNAAELTPAREGKPYPETALSLELIESRISRLTFQNNSDQTFYHGDPPDYCGLEVQLDGLWYEVPHKDSPDAGVGTATGPGDSFTFKPNLSPYGTLPDGKYRISFGYWRDETPLSDALAGLLYARFNRVDGAYTLPGAS